MPIKPLAHPPTYNVKPICKKPVDGRLSTGGGLRLCVNPDHQKDPSYQTHGPVWHEDLDWPQGKEGDRG